MGIFVIVVIVIILILTNNGTEQQEPENTNTQVIPTNLPTATDTQVVVTETPIPTISFTPTVIIPSPTPTPVIVPTLRILFEDQFNDNELDPHWKTYNNANYYPHKLGNGLITLDDNYQHEPKLTYYSDPDTTHNWVNYVIEARIIINKCVPDKYEIYQRSYITGRENIDYGGFGAFFWSSCDYSPNTELNVVVAIQGNRYTRIVNGEKLVNNEYDDTLQELQSGGISIYLTRGSSIDYIIVRELP
jgi:hypothetical protein